MTINSQGQLSSNLPKAYQLYPQGSQKCGNCTHFVEGYCNLFKASVQSFAWCKKWKGGADGS